MNATPAFLIVEDIPVNAMLLRKLLSLRYPDAEIHVAENGKVALDTVSDLQPDIVFMDIQMPVMNGLEATAEIRQLLAFTHLPIVGLSAGIMPDEKEACMRAGMTDYMIKPIDVENLDQILKTHLRA